MIKIFTALAALLIASNLYAANGNLIVKEGSLGIGTTAPAASAAMDTTSTTKGFLPPRMNTTERDGIQTPAAGLLIYNTTDNVYNYYNGSSWMSHSTAQGLRDTARGLRISCGANSYKVTVNADEVILQDSNGFTKSFTVSNKDAEISSIIGAGGRDVAQYCYDSGWGGGSNCIAFTAAAWYYIWLIGKNDGTVDVLLSLSSSAPSLPLDYTYKSLIGAAYTGYIPGNFFIPFEQIDNLVVLNTNPKQILFSGLSVNTWTTVSTSQIFPPTSKVWHFLAGSNGNQMLFAPINNGGGRGGHVFRPGVSGAYQAAADDPGNLGLTARVYWTDFEMPNINGNLYYFVNNANTDLYAVGWEY